MFFAREKELLGIIAVADVIKPSSTKAVQTLKNMGIEVIMITGDNARTAEAIAKEASITRVLADVLPGDKAQAVKTLQQEGKTVAMVGDGIKRFTGAGASRRWHCHWLRCGCGHGIG